MNLMKCENDSWSQKISIKAHGRIQDYFHKKRAYSKENIC